VSNHGNNIPDNVLLQCNFENIPMHITLNIQSILSFAFVALIFLPLPILILSAPLGYLKEKFADRNYKK